MKDKKSNVIKLDNKFICTSVKDAINYANNQNLKRILIIGENEKGNFILASASKNKPLKAKWFVWLLAKANYLFWND